MVMQTEDIQGIIVTGYGHLIYSSYIFLHIDEPTQAKQWLGKIAADMTTAKWETESGKQKPELALNIAFTYHGLKKLGLPPESLNTFSEEFVQGIATDVRANRFGDTNDNHPEHWEIGSSLTPENYQIHALLIVQAATRSEITSLCQMHIDLAKSLGVRQVGEVQQGYLPEDAKEHFGFHDSISQPNIEGSPKPPTDNQPVVKAGEFVLGYPNEYDQLPSTPTVPQQLDVQNRLPEVEHHTNANEPQLKDLGRNGSYMVFRKLHQDVAAFRRYFRDNVEDPKERDLVAAKFIGRWSDGTPLAIAPQPQSNPQESNLNNFYYQQTDPHGYGCPLGAHIRRVNPRDSLGTDPQESIKSVNRHRLIRRGALYGDKLPEGIFEDDGQPRGVLFFCINADIKRQFEFVQQTWINSSKFDGLYDEKDPILGSHEGDCQMTIQRQPVRQRYSGISRFVSVKGGAYFFLPSIPAIYFLAGVKE